MYVLPRNCLFKVSAFDDVSQRFGWLGFIYAKNEKDAIKQMHLCFSNIKKKDMVAELHSEF